MIVAVAPRGTGTVGVTVTTSLGTSRQVAAARFRYLAVPTVARLSPSTGSTRGGTKVTVTGTSFVEVRAVRFGTKAARSFRVLSPTRIAAIAPAGTRRRGGHRHDAGRHEPQGAGRAVPLLVGHLHVTH